MSKTTKLIPTLGLWTSISLVVGGIIGSGIFMKPAVMASQLGSPEWLLLVWVAAGIITLFGALSNAEVAAMLPETGGQFVFFKYMYGDFVAFIYGWAAFAVFNTAGVASIAYVFGSYVEYFIELPRLDPSLEKSIAFTIPFVGKIFPLENLGVKSVTITIILGLTLINIFSTRSGGNIQVVFTFLKMLAITVIIGGLVISGEGNARNLSSDSLLIQPEGMAFLAAVMAAMSGAFWAYDGWNNITFVAGEIKNPQRNIPRSLFIGILVCILVYSLVTLSYVYVLPIDAIATSTLVASDAAKIVFGGIGAAIIAGMVILSTFGTTNGNILATARVSFAMSRENRFFESIGKIHPRFGTPANALLLHGVYTSILVISGSFDMLTDMLIFVSWLFYGLSAAGVFILRYRMPDRDRPYKVWGYPWVPAIFVAFTLLFLVVTLVTDIIRYNNGEVAVINSLLGLLLTVPGIPLYWYFRNKKPKPD